MDDLLEEFLEETNESLDELDNNIIELEKSDHDEKLINSIFRTFHTIKGTCGFLDLNRLGKIAHATESLISRFRDNTLDITSSRISLILDSIERIKTIIDTVSQTGSEPPGSDDDLISIILAEVEGKAANGAAAQPTEPKADEQPIEPKADAQPIEPKAEQKQEAAKEVKSNPAHDAIRERQNQADKLFEQAMNEEALHLQEQQATSQSGSESADVVQASSSEHHDEEDEGKVLKGKDLENYIDNLFNDDEDDETATEDQLTTTKATDEVSKTTTSDESKANPSLDQAQIDEMAANFGKEAISSESQEEAVPPASTMEEKAQVEAKETKEQANEESTAKEQANPNPFSEKSLVDSFSEQFTDSNVLSNQEISNIEANQAIIAEKTKEVSEEKVQHQTLKVNVDLLESLMNTVSELVLTRNQLLQTLKNTPDSVALASLHQLNNITTELQEGILKTRMQPIGTAWSKIPRLVRKLSMDLGKNIELKLIGEDTELDKQIIEQISDPMIHLIRNAADHGIEDKETRLAKGKPETGTITLKANQEGGLIIIEIMDDGFGLNFDKIKAKALSQGLISASQAEMMNNNQIAQLLFQPGFSTSTKVTAVSGRGVGLDVVKNNLNKINGSVDISSFEDQGSIFTLKIPLSLSIIAGLKVEVEKRCFVIPQVVVQEVIRHPKGSDNLIKNLERLPVLQFRGQLMPIIYMNKILELEHDVNDEVVENKYILVISSSSFRFGLVVDRILDSEEIVVKPLPRLLKQIDIFGGNTILGDGSVVMILDLMAISRSQGDLSSATSQDVVDLISDASNKRDVYSYLLFRSNSDKQTKLISLLSVFRIEEFSLSQVIYPQGRPSIHYHNQLMPIVHFDEISLDEIAPSDNKISTLIFKREEKYLAVVVDRIEDIIEGEFNLDINNIGQKIIGNSIIDEKSADIVDIDYFFSKYVKNIKHSQNSENLNNLQLSLNQSILIVSPDPIENQFLKSYLTELGARVKVCSFGLKAIDICFNRKDFNVILVKERLADMDGSRLIARLQENPIWQKVPMIALANNTNETQINENKKHGFADTVIATNLHAVIVAIQSTSQQLVN